MRASGGLRLGGLGSAARAEEARSMRLYVQARAALLQSICPPGKPGCRAGLECLVNEFYTADCAGMNQVQEDVCEVCRGTPTAERPGVNATKDSASTREGLVFHEYKQFFRSEYQLYRHVDGIEGLNHELSCAAMVMVRDQCGSTPGGRPSCQ